MPAGLKLPCRHRHPHNLFSLLLPLGWLADWRSCFPSRTKRTARALLKLLRLLGTAQHFGSRDDLFLPCIPPNKETDHQDKGNNDHDAQPQGDFLPHSLHPLRIGPNHADDLGCCSCSLHRGCNPSRVDSKPTT
ncbi:MAG: hypothetical protein PVTTEEND_000398 [Candidatus Fervidibacter sp.]|jgi:hypothetical protein